MEGKDKGHREPIVAVKDSNALLVHLYSFCYIIYTNYIKHYLIFVKILFSQQRTLKTITKKIEQVRI